MASVVDELQEDLILLSNGLGRYVPQLDGEEIYEVQADTLECLQDLARFLRRDNPETRDTFFVLGRWNVVKKHLIPLIMTQQHNEKLVLAAIKVAVYLTLPTESPDQTKDIATQLEYLRNFKAAFLEADALSTTVNLLLEPLAKFEENSMTEFDEGLIELVLVLIRNLLAIPDPQTRYIGHQGDNKKRIQDTALQQLHDHNVMDLLVAMTELMDQSPFSEKALLVLELLYHLLHGQNAPAVARTKGKSKSSTEGDAVLEALKREKQKPNCLRRSLAGNSIRFQSAYVRKYTGGGQVITRSNPLRTDMEQYAEISNHCKPMRRHFFRQQKQALELPEVSVGPKTAVMLFAFVEKILARGYNTLMQTVQRHLQRTADDSDCLYYLRVAEFFTAFQLERLQCCALSKERPPDKISTLCGELAATMDEATFNFVRKKCLENMPDTEAEKIERDEKTTAAALGSLKEMLKFLDLAQKVGPKSVKLVCNTLLFKIFHDSTETGILEMLKRLSHTFEQGKHPRFVFVYIVEAVHVSFRLLENLEKAHGKLYVQKKKRSTRKKQVDEDKGLAQEDNNQAEKLEVVENMPAVSQPGSAGLEGFESRTTDPKATEHNPGALHPHRDESPMQPGLGLDRLVEENAGPSHPTHLNTQPGVGIDSPGVAQDDTEMTMSQVERAIPTSPPSPLVDAAAQPTVTTAEDVLAHEDGTLQLLPARVAVDGAPDPKLLEAHPSPAKPQISMDLQVKDSAADTTTPMAIKEGAEDADRMADLPDPTQQPMDVAPSPSKHDIKDGEEEEDDEVEEVYQEVTLDMKSIVTKFVGARTVQNYCWLLKDYRNNSPQLNHAIVKYLYRVCYDVGLAPLCYQVSIFTTFSKLMGDQCLMKSKKHEDIELLGFVRKVTRGFFRRMATPCGHLLFLDCLLSKYNKEAVGIEVRAAQPQCVCAHQRGPPADYTLDLFDKSKGKDRLGDDEGGAPAARREVKTTEKAQRSLIRNEKRVGKASLPDLRQLRATQQASSDGEGNDSGRGDMSDSQSESDSEEEDRAEQGYVDSDDDPALDFGTDIGYHAADRPTVERSKGKEPSRQKDPDDDEGNGTGPDDMHEAESEPDCKQEDPADPSDEDSDDDPALDFGTRKDDTAADYPQPTRGPGEDKSNQRAGDDSEDDLPGEDDPVAAVLFADDGEQETTPDWGEANLGRVEAPGTIDAHDPEMQRDMGEGEPANPLRVFKRRKLMRQTEEPAEGVHVVDDDLLDNDVLQDVNAVGAVHANEGEDPSQARRGHALLSDSDDE
eukprot:scaffold312_cov354-Prasinococcus_capsulatus_cf.AAC.4